LQAIHEEEHKDSDAADMRRETVLAALITTLDSHLQRFEKEGFAPFQERYLKAWLHSGQHVKVKKTRDSAEERNCVIEGLCENGFLKARDVDTGDLVELHPDGNSLNWFDNLVVSKSL